MSLHSPTDLNSIKGNIYSLINLGVQYILNHINWKVSIDTKRNETPEIPVAAIREIVVNAFAHAMYSPTPEIEIDVFPGKVTIYNPGSFPDNLDPKDFVESDIASIKRNPLILDVLYRCKDVEKSGSGFKRTDELCRAFGVGWETYRTAYGFYFTFHRKSGTLDGTLSGTLDDTNNAPNEEGLSDLERKVLAEIKNNNKVTREEIAIAIGKSIRSVQRVTNSLTEKKRILRVGNNRFGYWQVVKKG